MDLLEKANVITPVEKIGDIYFKRDDKFAPFGNGINGSKLRQCVLLFEKNKSLVQNGVITATSILSPQAPIVSELCKYYNVPCTIYYGGTTHERLSKMSYPMMCKNNGATIEIPCNCARQSALQYHVNKRIKETNEFNVRYGMDLENNLDVFVESTANQVRNLPDDLDNLVISCGSAITTIGILMGCALYNKNISNIYAVGIAPNRLEKINKYVSLLNEKFDINISLENFNYIDAFSTLKGFKYENIKNESYYDITFHKRYEAKTFSWLKDNINYKEKKTCMWIIGGEIDWNPIENRF